MSEKELPCERAKQYGGIIDHYYMAEFLREDKSLFNSQGDGWKYEFLSIPEAIRKIKTGPESSFNPKRIEALELVASQLRGNHKPAFAKW